MIALGLCAILRRRETVVKGARRRPRLPMPAGYGYVARAGHTGSW